MGRSPCCAKEGLNRGAWTAIEDNILLSYINSNGDGCWRNLPMRAGLKRCGKSCRLRWLNYLRPDIKRGNISSDEEDLIVRLHKLLGNRWSLIAGRLPGRTDNEIKNYWNTTLVKRLTMSSPAAASASSPLSRTKAKNIPLTPSNNHSHSPPLTATRPRVTRAKPVKPIDPPPPLNDNQTQSPSLPPSISHAQGTTLLPFSCDIRSEENRDGDVGDLSFVNLGSQILRDEHCPNGLITIDDEMMKNWAATYDSTDSLDMLDVESLASLLDLWP